MVLWLWPQRTILHRPRAQILQMRPGDKERQFRVEAQLVNLGASTSMVYYFAYLCLTSRLPDPGEFLQFLIILGQNSSLSIFSLFLFRQSLRFMKPIQQTMYQTYA